MERPAVILYNKWRATTGNHTLSEFLRYLRGSCHAEAHDLLTEDDLLTICELSGDTPESCEEALMESAWP